MKNLTLFDMAVTDEEMQRPIPNKKWVISVLVVATFCIVGWIAWHW